MKYDYIIVGQGLSGSLLTYELLKRGKRVCIIQKDGVCTSSAVAPGMYNPLVLKRYTLAWKAPALISELENYYSNIEEFLSSSFIQKMDLYRLFTNQKEADLWIEKSDQLALEPFMSPEIYKQNNPFINKTIGLGKVNKTGRVVLIKLMEAVRTYLIAQNSFVNDQFDYSLLDIQENHIEYKDIKAQHIIFSEGYQLKENPWFKDLPLKGTKGELITIRCNELKLDNPIKSSILIMPLGNDLYRVGASFNWDEKDDIPTETGKKWLISKLEQIINCNFEIVEHNAGIRPTVVDRRPLIGTHKDYKNLHVFNGMGTRGVMLAPTGVKMLIDAIEHNVPLDQEWDIKRFKEDA